MLQYENQSQYLGNFTLKIYPAELELVSSGRFVSVMLMPHWYCN